MTTIRYQYKGRNVATVQVAPITDSRQVIALITREHSRLGEGVHGSVYPAMITCESVTYQQTSMVIKIIRNLCCDSDGKVLVSAINELVRERDFFQAVNGGTALSFNIGNIGYLVYKRLPGQTLTRWLANPDIAWIVKLRLIYQVFVELKAQLHDRGIYHGDLKPDNILIKKKADGSYQVGFIDFGWSYKSDEEVTTTDYPLEEGEEHYWHPTRREVTHDLPARPYYDLFSLCKNLITFGLKVNADRFHGFLATFCELDREQSVTINAVLTAIKAAIETASQTTSGLNLVKLVEQDLGISEKNYLIQLAATKQHRCILTFLKEKDDVLFADVTELQLQQAHLEIHYHRLYKAYSDALTTHCLKVENLASLLNKNNDELRAWLPEEFSTALDPLPNQVRTQAHAKAVELINIELRLLTAPNPFTASMTVLRAALSDYQNGLSDEELGEIRKNFRKQKLAALQTLLNHPEHSSLRLFLFAYGKQHFKTLVATIAGCEQLAPSLSDDEVTEFFKPMLLCEENIGSVTASVIRLLKLQSSIQNTADLTKKTGIRIELLATENPLTEARAKIESTLVGCLIVLSDKVLLDYKTCCAEHDALDTEVLDQYWTDEVRGLKDPEAPAATSAAWLALHGRLRLSFVIFQGFVVYQQRPKTADTYQHYVLYNPDKHSLSQFCKVVADQTGKYGSFRANSFFICVLDKQHSTGSIEFNPFYQLLDAERLTSCYNNRNFLATNRRPRAGLFRSAAQASRDEFLNGVRHYASAVPTVILSTTPAAPAPALSEPHAANH